MAYREDARVFVGNLPMDVREREIEDLFYKYGKIRGIDLKVGPRPPAFAFVEFTDPRDAQDAIRGRDGYEFGNERLRVELSHGVRGARGGARGGGGGGSHGPSRRTDYRVIVTGLPVSCSWQDLKDHMRRAGDVTFSQVMRDGSRGVMGLIDYATLDDMENALRKLDGSDFRNPYDSSRIRVKEDREHLGGSKRRSSRSRSRSRSKSRSRSRSPARRPASRSRSRSRSKSPRSRSPAPRRDASRSRSRSRTPPRRDASRSRSRSPAPRRDPSRSRSRSASRSPSRSPPRD